MPRPAITPEQRAAKIADAGVRLRDALAIALASANDPDVTPGDRMRLWAVVEEHGATIHRQSRILAGKSRGG